MNEDFINLEKKPDNKKDVTLSILVLILVFSLVFVFVTLREHSMRDILSAASQKILDEVEDVFLAQETEETEEERVTQETEEEIEAPAEEPPVYREVAKEGDGLTHLARNATTSHMEEEGLELSDEERIYIEDYVQKRLAPEKTGLRLLEIGEEIEISGELIEEAVVEAQALTPSQLDNLTQYSALVSF